MIAKLATSAALAGVLLLSLMLGASFFAGVVVVAGLVATAELYRIEREQGSRPLPFAGFAAVIAFGFIAYHGGERAPQVFPTVVAGAFVLAAATLVVGQRIEGATLRVAQSMLGVMFIGSLSAYAIVLRRLPSGDRIALAFVVLVAANEIGSALASRRFSPAWKILGATLATAIAGVVIAATLDPPFDRTSALILAGVVAVAAPLGRATGAMLIGEAKHASRFGGLLGRIDAGLVAAPLFFYTFRALAR